MSNELHEILSLYLPKNFPNRGALERRINAVYTHNDVIEQKCLEALIAERKKVAFDNYHGHTFSDATNWQGKFEKFIESNERRIKQLEARFTNLQNKEK